MTLKVAFIASEAVPYAKTGGLADVVGSLSQYLRLLGVDTRIFMPRYKGVGGTWMADIDIELNGRQRSALFNDGHFYFIDHAQFFQRDGLYGTPAGDYTDNCERFTLFNRAVCEILKQDNFDIAHCHDWQSGLVPLYMRDSGMAIRTVFTIHNIGYQGRFSASRFPSLGLEKRYFTPDGIEFYGEINFLKAGVVFSDEITTVSPTYAREIQTAEFGFGLEGILQKRAPHVHGIINGIDSEIWDPSRDTMISARFDDFAGKQENKGALAEDFQIDPARPLIGMVTRIAGQKGFDILAPVLDEIVRLGFSLIILGIGEEVYHTKLMEFAKKFPRMISLHIKFDERLAHRIYAGSDFFLMPSQYEPCGLGQMISMRYGTVPIVHRVGGLADTVVQFDPNSGAGSGFLFSEYSREALLRAARQAREVYARPIMFKTLSENCMKHDFSWKRSALEYRKLYEKMLAGNTTAA